MYAAGRGSDYRVCAIKVVSPSFRHLGVELIHRVQPVLIDTLTIVRMEHRIDHIISDHRAHLIGREAAGENVKIVSACHPGLAVGRLMGREMLGELP
jgi:hypothetical protein